MVNHSLKILFALSLSLYCLDIIDVLTKVSLHPIQLLILNVINPYTNLQHAMSSFSPSEVQNFSKQFKDRWILFNDAGLILPSNEPHKYDRYHISQNSSESSDQNAQSLGFDFQGKYALHALKL